MYNRQRVEYDEATDNDSLIDKVIPEGLSIPIPYAMVAQTMSMSPLYQADCTISRSFALCPADETQSKLR